MIVTQNLLTYSTRTHYDLEHNTLSRTLGGTIHTVSLKSNDSIQQVDKISKLDDETFQQLSEVQTIRRSHAKPIS